MTSYGERKTKAFMDALLAEQEAERTAKIEVRDTAWKELFTSMRKVRDLMVEDNGGTHEVDPKDTWLAYMIGRLDELIGHWDPDASSEERELADRRDRRPPKRH
jgi:hypothetical protein